MNEGRIHEGRNSNERIENSRTSVNSRHCSCCTHFDLLRRKKDMTARLTRQSSKLIQLILKLVNLVLLQRWEG